MNHIGAVKYIDKGNYWSNADLITVSLDSGNTRTYNENSLRLYKGDDKMANLIGNYDVALVKFLKGTNTTKEYAFALFDKNVVVGDLVVCDSSNAYSVAKVSNIVKSSDYNGIVSSEVVCRVDFSDYERRKENRKQMESLKKMMDEMVAKNQELILYQAIAEKSPEMAELLEKYKELANA
jgi:hypothetical protein